MLSSTGASVRLRGLHAALHPIQENEVTIIEKAEWIISTELYNDSAAEAVAQSLLKTIEALEFILRESTVSICSDKPTPLLPDAVKQVRDLLGRLTNE